MSPGQAIAHYRILSKLGEGGMGEVWRATDTKLNREVVVKVLPEAFAQDSDRMARFTREAQVLASLNHPNIAAIHGVEERTIVMEFVRGSCRDPAIPNRARLDNHPNSSEAASTESGSFADDACGVTKNGRCEAIVSVLDSLSAGIGR